MSSLSTRQLITLAIVSGIMGGLTAALGDRAWLVMPPVAFLVMLGLMTREGRLTLRWVLLAATGALLMGAFLKVT